MKNSTTEEKVNKHQAGRILCIGFFWLVAWQLLAMAVGNSLLLPTPFHMVTALGTLVQQSQFYLNMGWTVARCLIAMALSFVTGTVASWCAYRAPVIRSLLALPVGFFKAVPVMAIIIYVILLAKADWVAVIVCFLMCFPVVYINVLEGLDSTPKELLEVGKVYNLTSFQKIRLIYVPSSLPQIKAAVKLIAGLSWKAVVAAEVLSIPKFSLGYEMMNAKYYLETPKLFDYILVIVVLSITLEKIINIGVEKLSFESYEGSRLAGIKTARNKPHLNDLAPPDINIKNLTKSFGDKIVFDNCRLTFGAGTATSIMGPSGTGKTTLVRIIGNLEKPDRGEIIFSKEPKLSILFQEDRLLPWLNVYDNMTLGLFVEGKDTELRIMDMARALEIEDELWKLPEELSGGMRHRVALGRTFLAESNLLILDEPFRGLDRELKERIADRLWEKETDNKTVIVVTHSKEDALRLGQSLREMG